MFLAPILNQRLDSLDPGFAVVLFGGLALYWVLGAIIVLRADGHTIGWLFTISAAMLATVFGCWASSGVAALADPDGPLQAWFVAGSVLFPIAMTLALPAVTISFPTGSLPGPAPPGTHRRRHGEPAEPMDERPAQAGRRCRPATWRHRWTVDPVWAGIGRYGRRGPIATIARR
ncbi:MAG: hypothetical protein ABIP77_04825 [Candidatus Limnocylindrales bacterium]